LLILCPRVFPRPFTELDFQSVGGDGARSAGGMSPGGVVAGVAATGLLDVEWLLLFLLLFEWTVFMVVLLCEEARLLPTNESYDACISKPETHGKPRRTPVERRHLALNAGTCL
jgi:hypothetical protein